MSKFKFSEDEISKLKNAVSSVEEKTSGEIVPYIVKQSDNYYEAPFIATLFISFLCILFVNILSQLWILPIKFDLLIYSLLYLLILVITFLIVELFPQLKILLISEKREIKMVEKRAMEAFLSEEIFKTSQRTGILIFVSELERNVKIIADTGINQKVNPEEWSKIVNELTIGIKKKDTLNSLVKSIENCGELLLKYGFSAQKEDSNELNNEVKLG